MSKIQLTPAFKDDRGEIVDLIHNEVINAVTLISFRKGAVRGNHYHQHTTQWNYLISGKIKYYFQKPGEQIHETIMHPGDFIVTYPNISHALVGLEDAIVMVFTSGPRGGKEYESDTFRLNEPIALGF